MTIVAVGSSSARTAAIISGAIQGALAHPPENVAMEKAGMHVLVDLASLNLPSDDAGVSLQKSWVQSHQQATQELVDSVVEAIAKVKSDEPFTKQVIAKYYKLTDPGQIQVAYDYHVQHVFQALPFPNVDQFTDAVNILSEKTPEVRSYDLSQMIDTSYVQNAANQGLQNQTG